MSQDAPEANPELTQAQIKAAEAAEQASLNESQKSYLLQRVVLLRVRCDRLQAELDEAKTELEALRAPSDGVEGPTDPELPDEKGDPSQN